MAKVNPPSAINPRPMKFEEQIKNIKVYCFGQHSYNNPGPFHPMKFNCVKTSTLVTFFKDKSGGAKF